MRKNNYQLKAIMTVEASFVFGICILVIYLMISVSFILYNHSYTFVEETTPDELDAVRIFRLAQMGEDILNEFKE